MTDDIGKMQLVQAVSKNDVAVTPECATRREPTRGGSLELARSSRRRTRLDELETVLCRGSGGRITAGNLNRRVSELDAVGIECLFNQRQRSPTDYKLLARLRC